jgi:hypothetical protein
MPKMPNRHTQATHQMAWLQDSHGRGSTFYELGKAQRVSIGDGILTQCPRTRPHQRQTPRHTQQQRTSSHRGCEFGFGFPERRCGHRL